MGVWDTVGIDCIAMNVNDTICVGAEPMSFVDYIALDKPNEEITEAVGKGLYKGAELSNMEIVGGEIAVLPEMVNGLDLSGTCLGYVPKDRIVTGQKCRIARLERFLAGLRQVERLSPEHAADKALRE